MGILNFLSGGRARGGSFEGGKLATGNHAISADRALAPTSPAAITPANPGNFATIRSVPVVPAPRYFNRAEAGAIRQLATQKRQDVSSTKAAYKGLRQIEKADAIVHSEHRDYETAVAKGELKKKRSDVRHAKALHGMRPAYAQMTTGLSLAEQRAALQIEASRNQQLARFDHFRSRLQGVR